MIDTFYLPTINNCVSVTIILILATDNIKLSTRSKVSLLKKRNYFIDDHKCNNLSSTFVPSHFQLSDNVLPSTTETFSLTFTSNG